MAGYVQTREITVIPVPDPSELNDGEQPDTKIVFMTGIAVNGLDVRTYVVSETFAFTDPIAKSDIDGLEAEALTQAFP